MKLAVPPLSFRRLDTAKVVPLRTCSTLDLISCSVSVGMLCCSCKDMVIRSG